MTDLSWTLVPIDPTEDMITAATGVRPSCGGYGDISSRCVRDWNAMIKAAPQAPSRSERGKAITVDQLARYLFETEDPSVEEFSWPEHEDDDGSRGGGGWTKIVSNMTLEEYRDKAVGLLRFMGCEVIV